MKPTAALLGLAGACAACCAVPSVLPFLAAGALSATWLNPPIALSLAAGFVAVALAIGAEK